VAGDIKGTQITITIETHAGIKPVELAQNKTQVPLYSFYH
jgi:hypothetical protein